MYGVADHVGRAVVALGSGTPSVAPRPDAHQILRGCRIDSPLERPPERRLHFSPGCPRSPELGSVRPSKPNQGTGSDGPQTAPRQLFGVHDDGERGYRHRARHNDLKPETLRDRFHLDDPRVPTAKHIGDLASDGSASGPAVSRSGFQTETLPSPGLPCPTRSLRHLLGAKPEALPGRACATRSTATAPSRRSAASRCSASSRKTRHGAPAGAGCDARRAGRADGRRVARRPRCSWSPRRCRPRPAIVPSAGDRETTTAGLGGGRGS